MSENLEVEITLPYGNWQWVGTLSKKQLEKLCAYADALQSGEESV